MTNKVDWALKTNNYLVRTVRPDITNKVDWPLKTNNYLVRTVRPDITNKADWPLKTNNYLVRRDECDSRHVHARMDRHQRTRVRTHIGYTIYNQLGQIINRTCGGGRQRYPGAENVWQVYRWA